MMRYLAMLECAVDTISALYNEGLLPHLQPDQLPDMAKNMAQDFGELHMQMQGRWDEE